MDFTQCFDHHVKAWNDEILKCYNQEAVLEYIKKLVTDTTLNKPENMEIPKMLSGKAADIVLFTFGLLCARRLGGSYNQISAMVKYDKAFPFMTDEYKENAVLSLFS